MFIFRSIRHLQEASATDGKGKFPGALSVLLGLPWSHMPGLCWEVEEGGASQGCLPRSRLGIQLGPVWGLCKSSRGLFDEGEGGEQHRNLLYKEAWGWLLLVIRWFVSFPLVSVIFTFSKLSQEDQILSWKDQVTLHCENRRFNGLGWLCKTSVPADLTRFQNRCVGINLWACCRKEPLKLWILKCLCQKALLHLLNFPTMPSKSEKKEMFSVFPGLLELCPWPQAALALRRFRPLGSGTVLSEAGLPLDPWNHHSADSNVLGADCSFVVVKCKFCFWSVFWL